MTAARAGSLGLCLTVSLLATAAGCGKDGPRPLENPGGDRAGVRTSTSPPNAYAIAERDVRAAVERYDQAFLAAVAAPEDLDKTERLLSLYVAGAPERDGMEELLQTFLERGWAARQGALGYQTVESVEVEELPPAGRATSVTCTFDDAVVYDAVNRAPDGGEMVVSGGGDTARTAWTWVFQQGAWRISEARTFETWTGENRCPPQ